MRLILLLAMTLLMNTHVSAEVATFAYLKTVKAVDLQTILTRERSKFLSAQPAHADYKLPPPSIALNDVDLFTVRYESLMPERGNKRVRASGLLAIPVLANRKTIPAIIYDHGTVYGKYEVPSYAFRTDNPTKYSHYDGAYETRYMVALFGGNGYIVMAADYFGMGDSADLPEAYFVKASAQQATYDLYRRTRSFLKSKGVTQSDLFVGGWSLGGLNATGLLEKLEDAKVPVRAAFTASAPSDPFAALNGLVFYPRPDVDAPWTQTVLGLSVFAFDNYYSRGLARKVLVPDAYEALKSVYTRSYAGPEGLMSLLVKFGKRPLIQYLRAEYRDPSYFAQSTYGRLLAQSETYRRMFKTPLKMFYGSRDEVIKEMIGRLGATYQGVLIGNESDLPRSNVTAVKVTGADHRRTFISAAPEARAWMDRMVAK